MRDIEPCQLAPILLLHVNIHIRPPMTIMFEYKRRGVAGQYVYQLLFILAVSSCYLFTIGIPCFRTALLYQKRPLQ